MVTLGFVRLRRLSLRTTATDTLTMIKAQILRRKLKKVSLACHQISIKERLVRSQRNNGDVLGMNGVKVVAPSHGVDVKCVH